MKEIKLNNKKYKVPENWNEVTLRMQMKVTEDTEKISIDELKKFAILSGYAGIPMDELKRAKLNDLQELFKAIGFVNKPLPEEAIIEFDFNGSHYYCGQNLVDMEFQDFISIENAIEAQSGNTYNALPLILAIMSKKKKDNGVFESIDDYDIRKRGEEFIDLPLPIAHQLSLFFYHSTAIFSNLFQLYLKPENQKAIMQKQIDTVESMLKELGGRGWLTRCVTGILRISLKYIRRQLDKHYTSTQ